MSPPVVPTISAITPQTILLHQQVPQPKQYNKDLLNPELYKHGKQIPQEKIQDTSLKMTQKLAKLNFRDTGFPSNATAEEKNSIIALSMYYQLVRFDPSNKFVTKYRNKDIIQLYRNITEKKMIKANALTQIYLHIHDIEQRIQLNRSKNNDKNKNNFHQLNRYDYYYDRPTKTRQLYKYKTLYNFFKYQWPL